MADEIGRGPCLNCQATVAYKVNRGGQVFYRCEGHVDPQRRACGLKIMSFGTLDSEKFIAHFKERDAHAVQGGPANRNELASVDAPRPERRKAEQPKPQAQPDRKPEPKRHDNGGAFGGLYE